MPKNDGNNQANRPTDSAIQRSLETFQKKALSKEQEAKIKGGEESIITDELTDG